MEKKPNFTQGLLNGKKSLTLHMILLNGKKSLTLHLVYLMERKEKPNFIHGFT